MSSSTERNLTVVTQGFLGTAMAAPFTRGG